MAPSQLRTRVLIAPARLQLVKVLPKGRDWRYEPKLDGYRCLLSREAGGRVSVRSRNDKDLARWFPELVRVAEALPEGTVLDGEIVQPVADGVSFTELQRRLMLPIAERPKVAAESPVALVAFDLLLDRTVDVRRLELRQRRRRLELLVDRVDSPLLQLMTQTPDLEAAKLWLDEGLAMTGIEGVVAKQDETYPRPNVRRWQKVRKLSTIDVVVRGFLGEPTAPRLVVGLLDDIEGRVAGTTLPLQPEEAAVLAQLLPLATPGERPIWAPFDSDRYDEWFVIPGRLVAEIAYSGLDRGMFRHVTRFQRWRLSRPGAGDESAHGL